MTRLNMYSLLSRSVQKIFPQEKRNEKKFLLNSGAQNIEKKKHLYRVS